MYASGVLFLVSFAGVGRRHWHRNCLFPNRCVPYHLAMNKRLTKIAKYLTFILKHEPGSIGLAPDGEGYVNVEELVAAANASGKSITVEQVNDVVRLDEKQLYAFSEDGLRVRVKP